MDNVLLKGYKSIIIFMSERTNLITIILLVVMFSSVYNSIQNTILGARFKKIQSNLDTISINLNSPENDIDLSILSEDLKNVVNEIEKDNWNLHTKVITAIGQTHNKTLDPKTGVIMFGGY